MEFFYPLLVIEFSPHSGFQEPCFCLILSLVTNSFLGTGKSIHFLSGSPLPSFLPYCGKIKIFSYLFTLFLRHFLNLRHLAARPTEPLTPALKELTLLGQVQACSSLFPAILCVCLLSATRRLSTRATTVHKTDEHLGKNTQ